MPDEPLEVLVVHKMPGLPRGHQQFADNPITARADADCTEDECAFIRASIPSRQKHKARLSKDRRINTSRAMGAPKGNKFALGNKGGKGGPAKYHTNYAKLAALAAGQSHRG